MLHYREPYIFEFVAHSEIQDHYLMNPCGLVGYIFILWAAGVCGCIICIGGRGHTFGSMGIPPVYATLDVPQQSAVCSTVVCSLWNARCSAGDTCESKTTNP